MERITDHPVLEPEEKKKLRFTFEGKSLEALGDEVISSALFASGIKIFSYHKKDGSPQGIFCANGQCAQCAVVADGLPVKACVTKVREGMTVARLNGLPKMPSATGPAMSEQDAGAGGAEKNGAPRFPGQKGETCAQELGRVEEIEVDALIVGGGPAGLAAAAELGKLDVSTLIIDDKHKLGGKLVLQTHKFFGSVEDCFAGTRGIDIADKLEDQLKAYPSVKVWVNAACVAVFSDRRVGVVYNGGYYLVKPKAFISATGAREKTLAFEGNTLPGVYGAGAFQTLVNRDLVRPSKNLFIVGGGNVGLIAAYHALQAGIKVAGLIEAMDHCGGYKVHLDKIKRLGVPVYTSHTVVRAGGTTGLETVTVAQVDKNFKPLEGTEKTFAADTLLVAVGLNSVSEFHGQAVAFGMNAFVCGDAEEIAEASAAMFSGRITAHKVLKSLGVMTGPVPDFWFERLQTLKSRPGKTHESAVREHDKAVYPVLHCRQEIPCDPCATVCPKKSIKIPKSNMMAVPKFEGDCIGCYKCLLICPGLAVTIVDKRKDPKHPTVALPFEIGRGLVKKGDTVTLTDYEGAGLEKAQVTDVKDFKAENTLIVIAKTTSAVADRAAGLKLYEPQKPEKTGGGFSAMPDSAIICRCERISLGEIRKAIRAGVRDLNQLKAVTRAGMGACGAKTCASLIAGIYKSEGVDLKEVTALSQRPLFMEVPLGAFSNITCRTEEEEKASWSGF
ncbi:MAG TPA: sulfurtransferase [Elusimicrobia bacterium]|nr:sulfurtransferase [Elusimicrobiota bacterium]